VGTLAAAHAAVRVAEAAVATAEQTLRATRLVAPFAGTIAAVDGVAGELVPGQAGASLVTVVDLRNLTVTASFDAAQTALLAAGETATVTAPSLAGQAAPARLLTVSPLPDPPSTSGTDRGAGTDTTPAVPTTASTPATYAATFSVGAIPAGMRPGMQVEVAVAVHVP
jgi:multidrug efflux pump subunit AcrA (membrane-fusion protein)